jgi:two-component system, chemotaxis family, sensor kinase CheA
MNKEQLNQRLFGVFMSELDEHRRALDRDLLALETVTTEAERKELLENLFRSAHSLKGAARSVQVPSIERICHRLEQHFQDLRGLRGALPKELAQRLFAEVDALSAEEAKLGGGDAQRALGASAPPQRAEEPREPARPKREQSPGERALRVTTDKVDGLLSRTGELGTLASALDARCADFERLQGLLGGLREALGSQHPALNALAKALEHTEDNMRSAVSDVWRASERLDDEAQRLRMVPFVEACEGLERALRDLALSLGKSVELSIENGQVEIDRAIAQRLRDPLLHLLRNAVKHGIEAPDERRKLGKPPAGTLRIAAEMQGKMVEIVVADDGRGLDLARMRERAASTGLDAHAPEHELYRYALLPGFSTAGDVTEIAGRGVGLDAVKRSIEDMHGRVEIASSPGRGARFMLRLPLTLSKLRCVFATAGGRPYALPASHVVRVLRFAADDLISAEGRELLKTPEGLVPVASLTALLGQNGKHTAPGPERNALVLRGEDRPVALVVEELGAEREITVRALPARLAASRHVSAAALLELGRIALVLHPQELCRRALVNPLARAALLAAEQAARPRVLVAEDSATTRAVLKSVLEEAHYEVTTAQDGEEAFAMLERAAFDIVVSDVQMPHRDGFALTESLRRHERLARIPVILMTSLESEADRLRGLRAGASAYLTKGAFDHRSLLETMATLL